MKNIQENIYRVKSLMNLLTEGSTNPNDWKVGEYYIQKRNSWGDERIIIKITYKDESDISFDYLEYNQITKEKTKAGSEDKILVSQVPTQVKDGAIWEETNETVWNEISTSTTTTPTEPKNTEEPTTTPTEPKPTEEPKKTETPSYPSENNFSSIADDIYQDLIKNIIPNLKIKSSTKMTYDESQKKLNSIEFSLDIDGNEFLAIFSKEGLYLEQKSPKKQVKPVWNGKLLKYRNFKVSELNKENLPLRTQPEISFSEQVRILKKYIQELHLI